MIFPVKRLADLGFEIVATARHRRGAAPPRRRVRDRAQALRATDGGRDAVSMIAAGEVGLVINTPQGSGARMDGYEIRSAAVAADIPCITTVPGAAAAVMGIEALIRGEMSVRPLQELHAALRAPADLGPGLRRDRLRSPSLMTGSTAAARPALFRLGGGDAEAAHEWTLRRLAAPGPAPAGAGRRCAGRWPSRPRRARSSGCASRTRSGSPPAWTRTAWRCRPGRRSGSASSRSARSPGTPSRATSGRGCSGCAHSAGRHQPDGVQQRRGAGARRPAGRAARRRRPVPLGISLGKSKVTPLDDAVGDYLASLRALYPYGDYFAVNVSSPNTPGLRRCRTAAHLDRLLRAVRTEVAVQAATGQPRKPVLVKIAPDLTEPGDRRAARGRAWSTGSAGVIATNTTLARSGLAPPDVVRGRPGGRAERARRWPPGPARWWRSCTGRPAAGCRSIGVGGILDPDDARPAGRRRGEPGAALHRPDLPGAGAGPRLSVARRALPRSVSRCDLHRRQSPRGLGSETGGVE